MKKTIITASFLAFAFFGVAQEQVAAPKEKKDMFGDAPEQVELTSKKGVPIRPLAGEWGLGVNAVPFIRQAGNMANGNTNNNNAFTGFVSGQQIYGKYMVDANTAYRIKLRIEEFNRTNKGFVVEQGQFDPNVKVTDKQNIHRWNAQLGGGLEKRRGQGRVQGIYGVEGSLALGRYTENYEYANAMEEPHIAPESYDFGNNISTFTQTANSSDRLLERRDALTFSLGVNAFVGVEYFFAPKMSIGGEFTWGASYAMTGKGSQTREVYTNQVEEKVTDTAGNRTFDLDTSNNGGAIVFMLYF